MIKIFYCNSSAPSIPREISDHRLNKITSAGSDMPAMINSARAIKVGFASFGINEKDVIYGIGEYGKPFADNFRSIHFSITHDQNMAIIAFYDKKIGIDCEKNNTVISLEILKRFFAEKEHAAFKDSPLLLWCAKEAIVKYTGKGFASGRAEYSIPYFTDEISFDGIWLKRLNIEGFECVVCTDAADEIEIIKV